MDYIRFIVDGQRLDYDRKYYSSTDTIDTLYCNFKFETDVLGHIRGGWDLLHLWAQFHDEQGNVYIKQVDNNTCSIPSNCLRQRKFKMTLFATDTQDYMTCTKRYTTNEILFIFNGAANINYDGGVSPDEPMPTNWQLLLERVDECESAVGELSQSVSSIENTVDGLSVSLASESTARASADIRLEGLINDESTSRENADANLRLLINDEVNERVGGDNALQNSINALDTRVTANTNAIVGINTTVDGLSADLADESAARASADTRLEGLINDESAARANADTNLQSLINNRYTKTETDALINTESTARASADTRLEGLVSAESTARANADADLQTAINDEVTTRSEAIDDVNATVNDLSQNVFSMEDTVVLLYKILKNENSWTEIASLVRSGKANQFFDYGDQIEEDWIDVDDNNRAYSNVWDIAKFEDVETREGTIKGMFLKAHWATLKPIQFSHSRAFYACRDGLSAGTYHLTLGANWGNNAVKDKSYQFTIANDVPVGGKLAGFYSMPDVAPANWKVYVYAANGIDILENAITVTEGTDGVDLGVMPFNTRTGQMNSMQETAYGNNDWELSAYRQYLNSREGKGEWWTAQDEWDIAPDQLNTVSGFLCGISDELYNSMKAVKVKTWKNNPTHSGVESYTYDKVFLPSKEELYYNPQKPGEGSYYPLMKEQLGLDSPLADYTNYAPNITYTIENHNYAQYVRLRSANLNYAYYVWLAGTSGLVNSSAATIAYRCTPVCVIG